MLVKLETSCIFECLVIGGWEIPHIVLEILRKKKEN